MKISLRAWQAALLAILVIVWLGPLHHVVTGWQEAVAIDSEIGGSLDSADDVEWNQLIGMGYVLLLATTGFAILLFKPTFRVVGVPMLIGLAAAAFFNKFPYDTMIIIAPTSSPWLPTLIAAFSAWWILGCLGFKSIRETESGQLASRFTPHVSR